MTETLYTRVRQPVLLDKKLAAGGEGEVWQTDRINVVAKIFHQPDVTRLEKLQTMLQLPPSDPMEKHGHASIPWPQELVFDRNGKFRGYLMQRVSGGMTLNNVYNAKLRNQKAPGFNWYYLHIAALNVASIVDALHSKGYVIGDIKTDNFLINNQALVSVIDTDSFQVKSASRTFRSLVASDGFTPPELIGKDMKRLNRRPEHDNFRLAVIIYMLLTGDHPFSGQWKQGIEPLGRDEAIAGGVWPYGPQSLLQASPLAIPLDHLDSTLQLGFQQTFTAGHREAAKRLSARQWCQHLTRAVEALVLCSKNSNHYFHKNHKECTWCHRFEAFGYESFPVQTSKSELSNYHAFIEAAQKKDHQLMLKLWQEAPELRDLTDLQGYQKQMTSLIRGLENIKSFIKLCQSPDVSPSKILTLWRENPEWHVYANQNDFKVDGKPLQQFLNSLVEEEEELATLTRLLKRCDERFSLRKAYVEEEDQLYQRFKTFAKKYQSEKIDEPFLLRMNLAKERVRAWQKLSSALKEDERVLYAIWLKSKPYIEGFVQVQEQLEHLNNLEIQIKVLEKLHQKIQKKQSHEEILTLWELYPTLKETNFIKNHIVDDFDLSYHIKKCYQKRALLKQLRKAKQAGQVEELRRLWQPELCDEACFHLFQQHLSHASMASNKWARVRAAALEGENETLIQNWDENFVLQAYQEGIEGKVRQAFQKEYGFNKNIHHTGQERVFNHRDFLEIVYPWPLENALEKNRLMCSHLIFCARSDRFPDFPDDIQNPIHYQVIKKTEEVKKFARLFFPALNDKHYFSVFPGSVICGRVVEIGSPYQFTAPIKRPEIKYAFFRKGPSKKNSLFLQIFATGQITLPPFSVVINDSQPTHMLDKNQKVLAEMNAVTCETGETLLELEWKDDLPLTPYISISVHDRSFYDNIRVINLSVDPVS